MLDHEPTGGSTEPSAADPTNQPESTTGPADPVPAKAVRKRRKAIKATDSGESSSNGTNASTDAGAAAAAPAPKKASRSRRKAAAAPAAPAPAADSPVAAPAAAAPSGAEPATPAPATAPIPDDQPGGRTPAPAVLFMAPAPAAGESRDRATREPAGAEPVGTVEAEPAEGGRKRRRSRRASSAEPVAAEPATDPESGELAGTGSVDQATGPDDLDETAGQRARRRGRRGRGRGKGTQDLTDQDESAEQAEASAPDDGDGAVADQEPDAGTVTRRRRKRRRRGSGGDTEAGAEDGVHTVVKVREPRRSGDEVRGVTGSTRLEAKRQRRRGGREQRRTRPPVLSESEFLARREAVDRVMVIRQSSSRTQIGVLEDDVLVEHYVSRASGTSMVGSVYLGRVQNVLPSMEAAFVDVGRGRNAVLYAGEVNWDASGLEGKARSIEQALSSGDSVLVQVTKDPVGHKGARLTSNIALSGRHLVYTPHGNASGISRKLPDTERRRLRDVLKNLVPDGAGVIVRTAAESASVDELGRDVKRLQSQWEDIQAKVSSNHAPALLYSEPDLVVRVVRDLFNEDFRELVIEGEDAYDTVEAYLSHVSPDLVARLRRHTGTADAFAAHRIDEQILKGLDRKVFLPSGGHLVFDRTEAMTVIDVNTGKYTGTGGNLEETVTRNNLEAAEEIVRQLRLRDLGGIIVIDFIDMVLESNRELVLRRLTECLGRDRTKHQVTEITSLGLVQMTRKRVGAGLLEAFSEPCECCKGRGVVVHTEPAGDKPKSNGAAAKVKEVASASAGRRRGGRKAASAPSDAAAQPRARSAATSIAEPDDDTMGYDLSRYEQVAPPEPEDRPAGGGPAGGAPVVAGPGRADGPERAAVPRRRSADRRGGEAPDPLAELRPEDIEDAGLTSVFRRFRRRGGRHRP
ncbi:MAG: Rne/Rng family ribonuclease [Micromonosporaceae bacterium]|nr:Rne/Rng family ribonuclease [Micromonosporaceae bacterium]